MVAAACLTLAGTHFIIWLQQRRSWGHLLFCCSAVSAAVVAGFELASMNAQTPEQAGELLRWSHPALSAMIVSLVFFVRLYLHAGRSSLAWAVVIGRVLTVTLNFVFTPNLNYIRMTGIRHVKVLGGQFVSLAQGETRPWTLVGQLSALLLVIFLADAMIAMWRCGNRRRGIILCGCMTLSIAAALIHSTLVLWGVIQSPLCVSIAYLIIIAAMNYELSLDVVRTSLLTRQLLANETARAADGGLLAYHRLE